MRRQGNTNIADTRTTISTSSSSAAAVCRQKITLPDNVVVFKPEYRRRKRVSGDSEWSSTSPSPTKRRCVSPSGEHDENSSAGLTRPLAIRRRNFSELQIPALGTAAAATDDGDKSGTTESPVAMTKKIRYFSNFYRPPEPGEVFVGGQPTVQHADQPIKHIDCVGDQRPHGLPRNSSFPVYFMAERHVTTDYCPSLVGLFDRKRLMDGSVTSYPPWPRVSRPACDVTEMSL